MTKHEAIKKLQRLHHSGDTEAAHEDADDILCELLLELGFEDVVKAYEAVKKWYA